MTQTQKDIVLELYNKNYNDTEIAKAINMSSDTIRRFRIPLGLLNNKNRNIILNENLILEELKEHKTVYSIIKKYKCSASFIRNLAKKNNISIMNFKDYLDKIKKVKHNPFEDLKNPDVQYWLGMLATDGAIFKDRITLCLQEQDVTHIDKYILFLKGSNMYKFKSVKDKKFISYGANFRNINVVNFLDSLGITTKKSYTLDYKYTFNTDFLRGVIDGDGYIRKNHSEISVSTASEIFANQIKSFIIQNYNVNCTVRKPNPNMYCVGVYGRKQVEKVLDILYLNANTYLERKYEKAKLNSNI